MNTVDLNKATVIRLECTKCESATEIPLRQLLEREHFRQHVERLCHEHSNITTLIQHNDGVTELAQTLQLLAKIAEHNRNNPGGSSLGIPIRIKLLAEGLNPPQKGAEQ